MAAALAASAGCSHHNKWTDGLADPYPAATPQRVVAVTDKISPAVVRLDVAQTVYRDGKRTVTRGIGSGVIIDAQGHVLTNYHVAGRANEIHVTLANKERVPAKLIGDDHWTDLAIVQIDTDEVRRRKVTFSYAELGSSGSLIVGQDVMAFGTPYGLARTVTGGHVSATERTLYPQKLDIDGYETGDFANWIQMDAPINPGNSGGPLVDLNGKVVGINTRGGAQNLNFSVPIDVAKQVVDQLLASAAKGNHGTVTRSDLGMDLRPLQDLEAFYNVDVNQGVLINSRDRFGPAEAAGIQSQDILLQMNGQPTNVRFPEELAPLKKRIADLPVGSDVTLMVKRGKEVLTLTAKTVALEGFYGEERGFAAWGISARDVTGPYANRNQLDSAQGVWVTTKATGLPADKAEMDVGDIIVSVGNRPVTGMDEFVRLYNESVKRRDPRIPLEVKNGRNLRTVLLEVDKYAETTGPAASGPSSATTNVAE
jgi:serine protease Do